MVHNAKKIIIVGGNAAGPAAAAKAKRVNPEAKVILFEAGEFISTGTCELPYLISGEIDDYNKIVFFNSESFQKQKGVEVFTNHVVNSIDSKQKKIRVTSLKNNETTEHEYDSLILATGSVSKKYPHFSKLLDNAFYLKSITDYLKIQKYLSENNVRNVVVLGAGYIGLETADAFHKLGMKVTVVERMSGPLPGYDDEIRGIVLENMVKLGIGFHGRMDEPKINYSGDRVSSFVLDSRIIESDLVLVSVGVAPNNGLALSCGLSLGKFGGVKVDKYMRTSIPNIFAAGDLVEIKEAITNKDIYLPQATMAHAFGHVAGSNAAGGREQVNPIIKNAAVNLFGNVITTVGLTLDEAKKVTAGADSVMGSLPNLVKVMPNSTSVFGKIVFDKNNERVLGASFCGQQEVVGYADIISLLIQKSGTVSDLAVASYNYTPPNSPFVNLLSYLGRKAQRS
ncbi:MAG: FAD-dependent oxidoreductase [Bacteroidetes bacterium]|nr:FAD-dependent oxidoreductase [Bacteroidota bacterium]